MSHTDLDSIRRFAAHWDRVVNRNHFPVATHRLLRDAISPWDAFDRLSRSIECQYGHYGIGLVELARELLDALVEDAEVPPEQARAMLRADYLDGGRRRHLPAFLR